MSCKDNKDPIKICSQSNIPQVDETALECAECGFITTKCVIYPEVISYLGLPDNTDLSTVIETLMLSLIDVRNRVQIIEDNL